MDTAQWPQEIVVKQMEEIVPNNNPNLEINSRRVRPQKEQSLNCPRCNSTNTKFCYYNNYSLSQPRYFCKTCRRYWTEGGSLRNIPVGGGSRKNRRPNSSSSSSSSPSSTITSSSSSKNMVPPPQNPTKIHEMTHDLNLGFPTTHDFKTISELIQVPNFKFDGGNSKNQMVSVSASATASASSGAQLSAMELLTGFTTRGLGGSFVPIQIGDPNAVYHHQNGYHSIPEYKQGLSFSLDGGIQESNGGRLLFPFEDLKQVPSTTTGGGDHGEQNRDHQNHGDSNGYWNGMLGGGSW